MTIDVHTHLIPSLRPVSAAERAGGRPYAVDGPDGRTVVQRDRVLRIVPPAAWDVTARLAELDRLGVRAQVVSPAPFTFLYDCAPRLAADFAAEQNAATAAFCRQAPDRFVGLASVPLQDPALAVAELRRSVLERGLAGVEIGTTAVTHQLHDEELEEFFVTVEELDVPVLMHPGPLERQERTGHNGLAFSLARPVETELAIGSLVHGGVLERHPRLRLCVCHGGAGLPSLAGRWQAGWERATPGVRVGMPGPRALLRRLWADTLTYDPVVLPLVERTFGADHLVVGSDMPFAAQETPPGATAREAVRAGLFADGDIDLTANALALLGFRARAALYGPLPSCLPTVSPTQIGESV